MLPGRLGESAHVLDKALESDPGCKVAGPHRMLAIGVGEEIIILDWVGGLLLLNGVDVVLGSGVEDPDAVLGAGVDVLDELVDVLVPHAGVGVGEVLPEGVHEVAGAEVVALALEVGHELVCPRVDVVALEGRIVHDGLVPADVVEAEPRRRAVVVVVHVREYVGAGVAAVLVGAPDHLEVALVHAVALVLVVDAGEEEGVEAQLAEERSRGRVVAEGVDVPGHAGDVVEGLLQPAQPHRHLVHEVLVVHARLVRHAPARVHELQLSLLHQGPHPLPLTLGGLVPPAVEEGHLDDRELVVRVIGELLHDSVDRVLHPRELGAHVGPVEVVVDRLEPAHVVVRVGDQVHGQVLPLPVLLAVVLSHHLLIVEPQSREGAARQQCKHYNQQSRSHLSPIIIECISYL